MSRYGCLRRTYALAAALVVSFSFAAVARAQAPVTLAGTVADPQGLALPGVTVNVFASADSHLVASTVTDGAGAFAVDGLTPGAYRVTARLLGFEPADRTVALTAASGPLALTLRIGRFEQQVVVTAQMPEVSLETIVPGSQLERRAAQDVAGYLRSEPGVGAVRRGSINLEPTVRGLYEAQMGVFVDGTRTFAAGPARMDSEISHVSPHMLESIEVVKGPYALTQGSGTLSSLRAQTFRPPLSGAALRLHGRGSYNFGGNGTNSDAFGGVWGATDRVRFTLFHNTQVGHDYTAGDGATIPGDYQSYDTAGISASAPRPTCGSNTRAGIRIRRALTIRDAFSTPRSSRRRPTTAR